MATQKKTKETGEREESFPDPVYFLLGCAREILDKSSILFKRTRKARILCLKGISTLIDVHIDAMKKESGTRKPKLTRIKVED